MYQYHTRNKIGAGSIFLMILSSVVTIGSGVLLYFDRGMFWDIIPYVSIISIILNLTFGIFNFVRKTGAGFIFMVFFAVFTVSLVLSSIFGPFSLNRKAENSIESNDYATAIYNYNIILENYPSSRFSTNALENLPYAYFNEGDFENSIKSFKTAVDKELINYNDLEIKGIFSEIYPKIAKNYETQKEYLETANNYLNAVSVYEEIKRVFPDTNEAFIANYKIPEYLYMASENFRKYKDFSGEIESLEKIIKDYSNSDYYSKAEIRLFDAYISNAIDLSDRLNYAEAIDQVVKIFSLKNYEKLRELPEYKEKDIFNNIPANSLISKADILYNEENYPEAFYFYNIILKYHPQFESSVVNNMVESKIKIISGQIESYQELIPPVRGQWFNSKETLLLTIENKTLFKLTVYLKGPDYIIISIDTESIAELEIIAGEYTILAELNDQEATTFLGNTEFEPGRKYKQVFEILEETTQKKD